VLSGAQGAGSGGGRDRRAWKRRGGENGRRNLTPEQKSDLRGQRYNPEKGKRGGDQKSNPENQSLTAQRLGLQQHRR
jgi:hypothetical protein